MHWIMDRDRRVDHSLSALLVLQGLTLFVVIPFAQDWAMGRTLLDACHLAFAGICIAALTRHRLWQAVLVASIGLLTAWPLAGPIVTDSLRLDPLEQHEAIALVAFIFNGAITAVVAQHVFAEGRVTAHRVRGAVLLYLNVSALFAIAYGAIQMHAPSAFVGAGGVHATAGSTAAFTYFSLTTITTTGFGDITPAEPLTRSLATAEAVFGQLFPATLLARLVALHLAHEGRLRGERESDV
ncbi:potassium channel family protein [Sphingomonas metalli]|jgi:hypothetical protein|nr:potassium channel family protein [Sphingomonas metalli]